MRIFALFALGLLLVSSAISEEIYTSKEGGYSVAFPGTPREMEIAPTPKSKIVNKMVTMNKDGGMYYVKYTDYPEENTVAPEKMYDSERDTMAKLMGLKVVSEKKIDLNGVTGREIGAERKMNGIAMTLKNRMYLVKNRMYQVWYATMTGGDLNSKEVLAFLDSFKLTSK